MASRGDIEAQNDDFLEPEGADFSFRTWRNLLTGRATQQEKSKKGGDAEMLSRPVVTINCETSATSADHWDFFGEVESKYSQMDSMSYELSGGASGSGLITLGNWRDRVDGPFGGNWRLPVSPISVGVTNLWVRGKNEKEKWGEWAFKSFTRSPTAAPPIIPCECTVFTDPFLVINPADWTETDGSGIAEAGPDGWEHFDHAADFARLLSQGNFTVGGDFDICVEVDITNFTATAGGTTYFQFGISEGVKGGADAYLHIQVNAGVLRYYLIGTGSYGVGPAFPTGTGTHYLRFTRVGTSLATSVWNSVTQQFEWDGGPPIPHDGVWDLDPYVILQWRDTSVVDYIEGRCKSFCINAGIKI